MVFRPFCAHSSPVCAQVKSWCTSVWHYLAGSKACTVINGLTPGAADPLFLEQQGWAGWTKSAKRQLWNPEVLKPLKKMNDRGTGGPLGTFQRAVLKLVRDGWRGHCWPTGPNSSFKGLTRPPVKWQNILKRWMRLALFAWCGLGTGPNSSFQGFNYKAGQIGPCKKKECQTAVLKRFTKRWMTLALAVTMACAECWTAESKALQGWVGWSLSL